MNYLDMWIQIEHWFRCKQIYIRTLNQYATLNQSIKLLSIEYAITRDTLLLLKDVGAARLDESGLHPISQKTPALKYQPIERKEKRKKIVEDEKRQSSLGQ